MSLTSHRGGMDLTPAEYEALVWPLLRVKYTKVVLVSSPEGRWSWNLRMEVHLSNFYACYVPWRPSVVVAKPEALPSDPFSLRGVEARMWFV